VQRESFDGYLEMITENAKTDMKVFLKCKMLVILHCLNAKTLMILCKQILLWSEADTLKLNKIISGEIKVEART